MALLRRNIRVCNSKKYAEPRQINRQKINISFSLVAPANSVRFEA
jgi:hypothetical protein